MLRILRYSFKLLGDIFQSVQYNGFLAAAIAAVGLVLPFFSRQELAIIPAARFDSFFHIIEYIGIVFFAIFAIVILIQFLGAFCIFLSQQIPESIEITPSQADDHEWTFDEVLQKKIDFHFADLRILNREYEELTECYAILKSVFVRPKNDQFVDLTTWLVEHMHNKRLKWKSSDSCEVKIGPRSGLDTVRVFKVGIDLEQHKCVVNDFNICDAGYKGMNFSNSEFYVKIEVYGKLRNLDIRPIEFFGHIMTDFILTDSGITYAIEISKLSKSLERKIRKTINAT